MADYIAHHQYYTHNVAIYTEHSMTDLRAIILIKWLQCQLILCKDKDYYYYYYHY